MLVTLTRFMAEVGIDDRFATIVQAWVDRADGTALIVSAGHPPPLLVQPDGRAEFVGLNALPPTGCGDIDHDVARSRTLRVTLPVGSTLILYTDGLVSSLMTFRTIPPARKATAMPPAPIRQLDDEAEQPTSQDGGDQQGPTGTFGTSALCYSVLMIPQTCPSAPCVSSQLGEEGVRAPRPRGRKAQIAERPEITPCVRLRVGGVGRRAAHSAVSVLSATTASAST